jgi:hypothetical protein
MAEPRLELVPELSHRRVSASGRLVIGVNEPRTRRKRGGPTAGTFHPAWPASSLPAGSAFRLPASAGTRALLHARCPNWRAALGLNSNRWRRSIPATVRCATRTRALARPVLLPPLLPPPWHRKFQSRDWPGSPSDGSCRPATSPIGTGMLDRRTTPSVEPGALGLSWTKAVEPWSRDLRLSPSRTKSTHNSQLKGGACLTQSPPTFASDNEMILINGVGRERTVRT